MKQSESVPFCDQLVRGPAYLFLGQRWLVDASGKDSFLEQLLKKFAPGTFGQSDGYSALFSLDIPSDAVAFEWMAGRCPELVAPEPMNTIGRYHWNGVFTSAIDDALSELLRNQSRDVQRVMSMDYQPSDPRSRSKLHLWHLFGNIAAPEADGLPPLTRLALIRRRATATQMASQIVDLVTPLGTLSIEGYRPQTDWFNDELFYTLVSAFSPGQVHWFGAREEDQDHPLIKPLLQGGQLELHSGSLARELISLPDDAAFGDALTDQDAWTRRLRIAKRPVTIPAELYRQVQSTCRLVTEEVFAPSRKISAEEDYAEFRSFLYGSSNHPSWEAYRRGYPFRRDFQTKIEMAVRMQLSKPSERGRSEPVILHGATGSGKTIALAQLAFDLQQEGDYPVVFIDRVTRVRNDTLDRFCKWAEDAGAPAVVVIYDGMTTPREYLQLHRFLQSRGRKFVLVGSTYTTEINLHRPVNSVLAEPIMPDAEQRRFFEHLKRANFSELIPYLRAVKEESFLGQLYRLLPSTRAPLQAGLSREVEHARDLIQQQKIGVVAAGPFGTSIASVFAQIGLEVEEPPFGEKRESIANEEINETQHLIGLIMVPGQFGVACPFELLMRTLGRNASERLLDILRKIDIFQLNEDAIGNPIVNARTSLEAQLIVRRALGGAKFEIDYAVRLLRNVRSSFVTESREIDFAVELLRNIGPNGYRVEYYRPFFAEVAACLRELRINSGMRNVRLLLQESAFLREAAKATEGRDARLDDSPEKRQRLEQALDACREALAQLASARANPGMRSRLLVEMASTWGTLAKIESGVDERLRLVSQAHAAAWKAFAVEPGNHYAIDVVAWTARDILNGGGIAPEDRTQIVESVAHAFTLAETEDWDAEAANSLDRRRVELQEVVFNSEVSQDAFENLLRRGSAAGIVVKAWRIVESANQQPSDRRRLAAEALAWMNEPIHRQVVDRDPHAMFLRFKLWWLSRLGFDFNANERVALPFSLDEWNECFSYVSDLLAQEEFQEHPTLRLIEAVTLFHRGESGRGFAAFELMNTDLMFVRNRVIRRFLFSDPQGNPRHFSGTIVRLEGRDGALQISGFSRNVPFFAQEANRSDLRRGDDLQGFGVAFNMLGPIAEFRFNEPRSR